MQSRAQLNVLARPCLTVVPGISGDNDGPDLPAATAGDTAAWLGSVGYDLGLLATTLARWEDAVRHLEQALERSAGTVALLVIDLVNSSELLERAGGAAAQRFCQARTAALPAAEAAAAAPPSPAVGAEGNLFRREGDYWTIAFNGPTIRLKDSKGLHYLAHLLRHPGQEFHVLHLVQACAAPSRRTSGVGAQGSGVGNQRPKITDQGPPLDAKSKAEYRRRLNDLREELGEAERNSDLGRAAKARAEMEFIADQLAAAVGLGGRDRPAGSDAERARQTVTKGVKAALEKIRTNQPELARYLATSIKTGYFCGYTPDAKRSGPWGL